MRRLKDRLLSLFSLNSFSKPAAEIQPPAPTKKYSIFEPQQPFVAYDSYSSTTRQFLDYGIAHIFKTFPSESLVPLEDEGIGRLKEVYEAWFTKSQDSMARDKLEGIFIISIANDNAISGTVCSNDQHLTSKIYKHNLQCIYAGTGIYRTCTTMDDSTVSTGAELWIKASRPLSDPWIQSMHVPPSNRLNKLCLIAAPKPNFLASTAFSKESLRRLPDLTAASASSSASHDRSPVFELDSHVFVYICRLAPCSTVTLTAATNATAEPPVFNIPKIHRATTISTTSAAYHHHHHQHNFHSRSIFIHVISDYSKDGHTKPGGARLLLPSSIQLANGDGIHLRGVTPASDIPIKSIGYDRAQFLVIDMPGYCDCGAKKCRQHSSNVSNGKEDNTDAESI